MEINQDNLLKLQASLPHNTPILMLNLLRYKPTADYGETKNAEPLTGRYVYFQRYVPEFLKVAATVGSIQPFFFGDALAPLIAPPDEVWDNVALIEYPNLAAFRAVVESAEYLEHAAPHRFAALDDHRLIVTVKANIG